MQLKFKYLVVRRPLVQVLKCNASRLNRLGGGKEAAGESCCHRVSVVKDRSTLVATTQVTEGANLTILYMYVSFICG